MSKRPKIAMNFACRTVQGGRIQYISLDGDEKIIKSFKVLLVLSTGVTGRVIISGRVLMVDPIFI